MTTHFEHLAMTIASQKEESRDKRLQQIIERARRYLTIHAWDQAAAGNEVYLWVCLPTPVGKIKLFIDWIDDGSQQWIQIGGSLPISLEDANFEEIGRAIDLLNAVLEPIWLYSMEGDNDVSVHTSVESSEKLDDATIIRAIYTILEVVKSVTEPLAEVAFGGAAAEFVLTSLRARTNSYLH
jgi:hypothetical protein